MFARRLIMHSCAIAGLLLGAALCGQNTAMELFHKMQQALGGAERIVSVRDFDWSVRASTWNDNGKWIGEVRKRTRWVRRNYLRVDQRGPNDTYILYFDGTSGWEILPDRRTADLAGGEMEFARKYLSGFMLNVWLADRIPGYGISSPAPNVIRVSVNNRAYEQIDITLDTASWLPLREASTSLADPGHPVPSESRMLEWITVQGIHFPRRISVLHGGARLAEVTTEESS